MPPKKQRTPENPTENAPSGQATDDKLSKLKKELQEKSPSQQREILEKEVMGGDKDTAEKIIAIDPLKASAEQMPAMQRLEVVSYPLLGKLFREGLETKAVEKFSDLKAVAEKYATKVQGVEKIALLKLKEIAGAEGSPLHKEMEAKWKGFMERAKKTYERAQEIIKGPQETVKEKATGVLGYAKKFWEWMKSNPGRVIGISALIIGGFAAYKLLFRNKVTSSFWDKIGLGKWKTELTLGGGAALAALVAGGLVGPEIIDFIQKRLKLPEKVIARFKKLWGEGKHWEAIVSLTPFGDIKDKVDEAKETVKDGLKWLEDHTHFSVLKDKLVKFAEEHGFTIPHLDLAQIAKDLHITEGDKSSWLEFAGLSGAALLMFKWITQKGTHSDVAKGVAGGLAMNAGLFLFLVREGKDSIGGKLLDKITGEFDVAKKSISESLKKSFPAADWLIEDAFDGFSLQSGTDKLLDMMKAHPGEAMLMMNGMWLCRGLLVIAVKKLIASGGKLAMYSLANPGKAVIAGASIALLYTGRRTFIKDLVHAAYTDPEGEDAKKMLDTLYGLAGVDVTKPETVAEQQAPAFVKSITEDPIKGLEAFAEQFKQGEFSIGWTAQGAMLLVKGFSAPIQLTKLTWEAFKTFESGFSPENEGNGLVSMTVGGTEMLVFGSMAWAGFASYLPLIRSSEYGGNGKKLWRGIKSLIPGTKEWKFVLKSAAFAPLTPILKLYDGMKVRDLEKGLADLAEKAKKTNLTKAEVEEIQEIIGKMRRSSIIKDLKAVDQDLSKATFGKYSYELTERMDRVNKNLSDLEGLARDLEKGGDNKKFLSLLEDTTVKLKNSKKSSLMLIERAKLLMNGEFKAAFASREAIAEMSKMDVAAKPSAQADGAKTAVEDMEKKIADMEKELPGITDKAAKDAKTAEIAAMRKSLEALKDPAKAVDITKAPKVDGKDLDTLSDAEKVKKIQESAAQMEAHEKSVQTHFNSEVEKIVKEAKAAGKDVNDPAVLKKLEKLQEDIIKPFAKGKQDNLVILTKQFEALPPALKKDPKLVGQVARAIESTEGTVMTRLVKGAKGRAKLMVLMGGLVLAGDQLTHLNDPKREFEEVFAELGPELLQVVVDCMPLVGTASNFYAAVSGKESVAALKTLDGSEYKGRDVSGTWDRVGNAVWGTVGLAGDAVMILGAIPSGSATIWIDVGIRLAAMAGKGGRIGALAAKAIRYLPRIKKLAERMGGAIEFAKKTQRVLRGVENIGMVVGAGVTVGSIYYKLRYTTIDNDTEIQIPPELMPAPVASVPEIAPEGSALPQAA